MQEKRRFDWVDAAKGLSILLVVMMYSAYNVGEYTGQDVPDPYRKPEPAFRAALRGIEEGMGEWLRRIERL